MEQKSELWQKKTQKCTHEMLYRILPGLGACHHYNHHTSTDRIESSQIDPWQAHPVLLPDKKIITMKLHWSSKNWMV